MAAEPAGRRRIEFVRFLAVGAVPPPVLRELVARVSGRLHVPCTLEIPRQPIPVPFLEGRNQGHADRLLEQIEARAVWDNEALVGVTATDIGHPIFTHFFGRAQHGGRAAVVSLARLTPTFYGLPEDPDLTLRRAILEVIHELGHVAGLHHCEDYRCIMRFAPSVEAIDLRGTRFCAGCEALLDGQLFRHPPGPG